MVLNSRWGESDGSKSIPLMARRKVQDTIWEVKEVLELQIISWVGVRSLKGGRGR